MAGVHPSSWIQAASGPFCLLSNPPALAPVLLSSPPGFSLWISHMQLTFYPPQIQSQFLIPLLLILLSILPPSYKAVSHQASPLDPFLELPFLLHMCFLPSQDDSLPSTLKSLTSNPRFLPPLPCSPASHA